MRDAHGLLLRALGEDIARDATLTILETYSERWVSVTFTGARHCFVLALSGPAAKAEADRLGATLSEREFALAGHLVADIAVTAREGDDEIMLTIEALTVEEA
jgi:hypothetical protein